MNLNKIIGTLSATDQKQTVNLLTEILEHIPGYLAKEKIKLPQAQVILKTLESLRNHYQKHKGVNNSEEVAFAIAQITEDLNLHQTLFEIIKLYCHCHINYPKPKNYHLNPTIPDGATPFIECWNLFNLITALSINDELE